MRSWLAVCLLVVAVAGNAGCGGAPSASVEGAVTCDGRPLEFGSILFVPIGTTVGPTAGAEIANGKYSIPTGQAPVIGSHRIQILGGFKTGRKLPDVRTGGTIDEVVGMPDERFNAKSILTGVVQPGKNTLNYDVSSR